MNKLDKTVVVNFAPENGFFNDIVNKLKNQTIRDKPLEVGQKIALWDKKRGMRKGSYCSECFVCWNESYFFATSRTIPCEHSVQKLIILPRKILETRVKDCEQITMEWRETNGILDLVIYRSRYEEDIHLSYDDHCRSFVKADGFKSNKDFIDFFLKDPKLKCGEVVTKYIIRW